MNKLFVPILAALVITVYSSAFVIYEGRQAVITQFGKPVRTVTKAGLHFKTPFIQDARKVDLRILNWDGYPNQIPTKDKKYIIVDTTARWKITDPLKFIQTVQNEQGAKSRLNAILDGITRDIISGNNLVEAVRNSNTIFETITEMRKKQEADRAAGLEAIEEEVVGEVEPVEVGREKLSEMIIEKAREELEELGIKLIDVQLRRISYEASVQEKVYQRMISERSRVATKIRSVGKGEQAKIKGKTARDLKKIQSVAYKKVQNIKGKAEAKATRIYANALNQDPDFYSFLRKLEAYDKGLSADSKFLLSTKSKFWDVMRAGRVTK